MTLSDLWPHFKVMKFLEDEYRKNGVEPVVSISWASCYIHHRATYSSTVSFILQLNITYVSLLSFFLYSSSNLLLPTLISTVLFSHVDFSRSQGVMGSLMINSLHNHYRVRGWIFLKIGQHLPKLWAIKYRVFIMKHCVVMVKVLVFVEVGMHHGSGLSPLLYLQAISRQPHTGLPVATCGYCELNINRKFGASSPVNWDWRLLNEFIFLL